MILILHLASQKAACLINGVISLTSLLLIQVSNIFLKSNLQKNKIIFT